MGVEGGGGGVIKLKLKYITCARHEGSLMTNCTQRSFNNFVIPR